MVQSRHRMFLLGLSTLVIGLVSLIFPSSARATTCYVWPDQHACTYYSGGGHRQGYCINSPGGCGCAYGLSHQQSQAGCIKNP
jgi:hypothetical protein